MEQSILGSLFLNFFCKQQGASQPPSCGMWEWVGRYRGPGPPSCKRGVSSKGFYSFEGCCGGLMAAGGSVMGKGDEGKVSEPLWWLGNSGQRKAGRVRGWLELEKGAFKKKSLFLTEGLLLHNTVLVSTIHQHESNIGVDMSLPSRTSLLPPIPLGCCRAPVWVSWVI